MNILYFNPGRGILGKRLLATIKSKKLASDVTVYRTLDAFSKGLNQPSKDKTATIVLATTERDLLDIYSIKYLFCKTPLMLLLPDRKRDTVAIGHRCGPRSIYYIDSHLSEITRDLNALMQGANSSQESDDYEVHEYEAA